MSSVSHDYDKALTRLVIILQRLYEGETLGVSDLAEEFNVSTKTIQRDLNDRLSRFPITKEGRRWKMMDGHAINKSRSAEEELVLDMLGQIADGISPAFGTKTKYLFSKLQNFDENPFYSKVIIEDLSSIQHMLPLFQSAISEKKMMEVVYKSKIRIVKPYKIVSFEGYWYLYLFDLTNNKNKTFYIKDISKPKVLDDVFEVDQKAIDKLKYAINTWFEPDSEPFEVCLHATKDMVKYLARRPLSKDQRVVKMYSDGSIDIVLNATSESEILHEVKRWIPDLIVLSPSHIADSLKNLAEKYSDKYKEFSNKH
jgi:predicted DNA-binding transcriptional regulator YafY